MQYKTFRRICTAILICLALMLEVKAQNIPIYGNLTPSDSGALNVGASDLHWDTIFVNTIIPAVGSSDYSPWDTTATAIIQKDTTLNVGIGTTVPQTRLQVDAATYSFFVDSGFFSFGDTLIDRGGITWTPDGAAMSVKRYDYINGISFLSDDSTDIGLEVGHRNISSGAHTAQIEFHSNPQTGAGHIHLDLADTAGIELMLHFESNDSSVDISTSGTEISITASDSMKVIANIIDQAGQVNNVGSGTYLSNLTTSAGRLFFKEDLDNGTHHVRISAPENLTASYNLFLPDNDGNSGEALTTNGSGILSWAVAGGWTVVSDSQITRLNGNDTISILSANHRTAIGTTNNYIGIGWNIAESNVIMQPDSVKILVDGFEIIHATNTKVQFAEPLQLVYETSDVTNPPTDAELDAIFGTPATVGEGFTSRVKDSNSNNFYEVVAVGSAWYTFTATLAP